MSAPRSYSPFPRSPFMGGVLLIGESGITGAQSIGVLGCDSFRATGPGFAKFVFDAVQLLRLGFLSQRFRCENAVRSVTDLTAAAPASGAGGYSPPLLESRSATTPA